MSCPFVQPEVTRLSLSTGDFLDVKRELNAGEYRHLFADMVRDGMRPGEPAILDPERVGLTRILAFLVGWSFTDFDGRPVPVSEAALLKCHPAVFREIAETIEAHEREQDRQREERLKNPTGAGGLKAVS